VLLLLPAAEADTVESESSKPIHHIIHLRGLAPQHGQLTLRGAHQLRTPQPEPDRRQPYIHGTHAAGVLDNKLCDGDGAVVLVQVSGGAEEG